MKAGEDAHEIVFLVRFIVSSEQVIHSAPTLSTKTSRSTSGCVAMNVHLQNQGNEYQGSKDIRITAEL